MQRNLPGIFVQFAPGLLHISCLFLLLRYADKQMLSLKYLHLLVDQEIYHLSEMPVIAGKFLMHCNDWQVYHLF